MALEKGMWMDVVSVTFPELVKDLYLVNLMGIYSVRKLDWNSVIWKENLLVLP